jgi:hypothetical protein
MSSPYSCALGKGIRCGLFSKILHHDDVLVTCVYASFGYNYDRPTLCVSSVYNLTHN